MTAQVQVGVPSSQSDGTFSNMLGGKFGDQLLSEFMPRYYNLTLRGFVMQAHNTATQALTAALASPYTGLCLSNPVGSGKNLVLLMGQFCTTAATGGTDIASTHIIGGYAATTNITHTAALSTGPSNMLLGTGPAPVAKADSQATLTGTPRYIMGVQSGMTAQVLQATTPSIIDFGGMLTIPPGGYICWGALLVVSGLGSFIWAELPA